jgi:hypothetical protein
MSPIQTSHSNILRFACFGIRHVSRTLSAARYSLFRCVYSVLSSFLSLASPSVVCWRSGLSVALTIFFHYVVIPLLVSVYVQPLPLVHDCIPSTRLSFSLSLYLSLHNHLLVNFYRSHPYPSTISCHSDSIRSSFDPRSFSSRHNPFYMVSTLSRRGNMFRVDRSWTSSAGLFLSVCIRSVRLRPLASSLFWMCGYGYLELSSRYGAV